MTIQIIESFIKKEEAQFIVNNFSKNLTKIEEREGFYEDLHKRRPIKFDDNLLDTLNNFDNPNESKASALINHSMFLAKEKIEQFYGVQIKKVVGGMTKLTGGAYNGLHADMSNLDGSSLEEDSDADLLKYSGLIYLSSYEKDFQGGLLKFPKNNLSIEPEPGLFVFFKGDAEHPHEVTKVESGERHAIIMFFGD